MRKILIILILLLSIVSHATTYQIANQTALAAFNQSSLTAGDNLLLQKGQVFTTPIIISNSGTSDNPITIGAYGTGANPIITGFTTITGWTNEGGGIYSKVIISDAQTNVVTVDGVNTAMGRAPNAGTFNTYESCSGHVSITDNGLGTSTNWNGAEVVIRKNNWTWDRGLITNHTGDVLTYTDLTLSRTATANYGYFFQNDLRTLDQLGEWYHNTSNGKFYMYFGVVDPTTKTVKVATKDYGIYNYNATNSYDYVTCDNLNIVGFIKSGIYLATGTTYNIVQNCSINFCGRNGVEILGNANHNTITANLISNTTNGAIYCSGTSSYLTATNNTISNTGLVIGSNLGTSGHYTAISTSSTNDLIQYNSITNTGYDGMYINGNSTEVRNNLFDNSCLVLNDGGAIYVSGTHTSVTIDGNIVLNSSGYTLGTPNLKQYSQGVYLDEYSNGITVTNNTVANCSYAGIFVHKGHDDIITGNTCYNNLIGTTFQSWLNEANLANNTFNGNICVAKSATQNPLVFVSDYSGYATSLSTFTMSSNYYSRPIDDNASINTYILGTSTNRTLAQWQSFSGKDANSNKSPQAIYSESDLQFEYNAMATAMPVTLSRAMIDVKGQKYATSTILLQPYTSIVLMVDANPSIIGNPLGKKIILRNGTKYYINPTNGKMRVR
jgi:parallel beta-helix repeat protein